MDLFEERGFGFADFSVAVVFNFAQPYPLNELCPVALGSFGLISRDLIWTQSERTHTVCKRGGQEVCAEAGGLGGQPGAQRARTAWKGGGRGALPGGGGKGAGASSEGAHKHSPVGVGWRGSMGSHLAHLHSGMASSLNAPQTPSAATTCTTVWKLPGTELGTPRDSRKEGKNKKS